MKKNGWGLRAELLIILLFVVCLIISAIGLNKLGLLGENENAPIQNVPENTFDYSALEHKLVEASKQYYASVFNNAVPEEEVIIGLSTLKSAGYISDLIDEKSNSCTGYTKVINGQSGVIYLAYIKCSKYTTVGYEGKND